MADDQNPTNIINEVVNDESVVPDEPQLADPTTGTPPVDGEEPEAEQPVEETPETPETEEQPEEKPPSRREQLRIQKLLQKYGNPDERQQPPTQQRTLPNADALDYSTALDADPEVIRQLEEDRQRYAQSQYNEGLKRAEFLDWKTSLKIDAPVIEKKYPILDKNSPDFHPAVADAMNTWYLQMSGFDPNTQTVANNGISYAEFVESNMELAEEIAGQRTQQATANIAKQAATTGLRPDGSSAKRLNLNQAPEAMSLEELYAKIGQKPPKQ